MAGEIDTVKTDFAEQQERELIGTWDYSKRLLVKCESYGKYKEEEKPSKNALNIYKVMVWLEENNSHIIKNHAIKRHSRIVVPKELKDFILIIGEKASIAEESKQTQEEYEIDYGDCVIFQHKQQPGLDKESSSKIISGLLKDNQIYSSEKISEYAEKYVDKKAVDIIAEDIKSDDLTVEDIVKKCPDLKSTFQKFFDLKDKELEMDTESITRKTIENEVLQKKELKKIVDESKKEMKDLMSFCSRDDWEILAMKMYDRFCSDDDSDYKNDLLNKLFTKQSETKTCKKNFKKRFEEYIKKYNYDIISFDIKDFHESIYGKYKKKGEPGINRPKFDSYIKDSLKGSMICFHDTQGFNVYAEDIKIKNGKFSCKLRFDFYDHFGLDSEDVNKFGNNILVGKGFQSWYILQHLNEYPTGCKAFVDHANHEEPVEVEIE